MLEHTKNELYAQGKYTKIMDEAKKKDDRARTWAFVGYPESMPENWKSILDELMIPWACSPVHDSDVNESTNEKKKPHRHFVLSFEGKKSYEQIKEITDKLNATIPQRIRSIRGAVRYFLHLDNPEKFNYSSRKSEILFGGGFDLEDALKLSASETANILASIEDYILEKGVGEYVDLVYNVKKYHSEWLEVLRHNTFHLNAILKSRRNAKRIIDFETGEEIA